MGLTGEGTSADELWELRSREAIIEHLRDLADEQLAAKSAEVGEEDWKTVERLVLIRTIDSLWVEHLTELDDMRRGIGLRGYAQQDPLNEFKREAFQLYDELRGLIRHGVASVHLPGDRHPPAGDPAGGDPAVAASLARRSGIADRRQRLERVTDRVRPERPEPGRRAATSSRPARRRDRGGGSERLGDPARRTGRTHPAPDARVARRRAGRCHGRRRHAVGRRPEARASPRPAPGSGGTTRAGAAPAPSTRSATAADDIAVPIAHRRCQVRQRSVVRDLGLVVVAGRRRHWSSSSGYATYRIWAQGQRDEQRPADAIVVMGAAQYDGRPSPIFAARLDHAVSLYLAGVAPVLVVTGGKADGDRTTEAASARAYAIARGVPADGDPRRGPQPHHPGVDPLGVSALLRDHGICRRGLRVRPAAHAAGPADGPR